MKQLGTIRLKCHRNRAEIDIDGIIGVPDWWEFDSDDQKAVTYANFRDTVDRIREIDVKQVVVNIRSIGGNVADAILIYESLKSIDKQIVTRCYGYVASAATIIAQAASEGMREVSEGTLYLIHRSMTAVDGNSQDLTRSISMLTKTDDTIAAIYAARSGRPKEYFLEIMGQEAGKGVWLTPDETITHGLADKIFEAPKVQNSVTADVSGFGYPDIPVAKSIGMASTGKNRNRILSRILSVLGLSEYIDEIKGRENPATSDAMQAEQVKAKAAMLSTLAAREAARATTTKAKEDPAVDGTKPLSNQSAYEEDIKLFKNQ